MRKNIFVICIIITICGFIRCKNNHQGSEVSITYNKETIEINDTLLVELRIQHSETILPRFYIIANKDTILLPYDQEKDCGLFKAIGKRSGRVQYNGFVSVVEKNGQKKTESFEIIYNVK